MTKPTTSDILHFYLKSGLKIRVKGLNPNTDVTLDGITNDGKVFYCLSEKGYFKDSLSNIKPILHPLSSLTKGVLEDGKIPIVELAKLNLSKLNVANHSWKLGDGVACAIAASYEIVFQYHDSGFYYKYKDNLRPVHNQLQLFQQLIDWNFNCFGLDESEFIDKGSL